MILSFRGDMKKKKNLKILHNRSLVKYCRLQMMQSISIEFDPDLVLRWNNVGCTQALVHLVIGTSAEDHGERRDEMVVEREDCL